MEGLIFYSLVFLFGVDQFVLIDKVGWDQQDLLFKWKWFTQECRGSGFSSISVFHEQMTAILFLGNFTPNSMSVTQSLAQ